MGSNRNPQGMIVATVIGALLAVTTVLVVLLMLRPEPAAQRNAVVTAGGVTTYRIPATAGSGLQPATPGAAPIPGWQSPGAATQPGTVAAGASPYGGGAASSLGAAATGSQQWHSFPDRGDAPATTAAQDTRAFDRYMAWLKFAERERAGLRAIPPANLRQSMGDPDADSAANQHAIVQFFDRWVRAAQALEQNIARTRPAVPADLQAVDRGYLAAINEELRTGARMAEMVASQRVPADRDFQQTAARSVERQLGIVNAELSKAYSARGLAQSFQIDTRSLHR